ncbi:hypothetical protein [Neorhizobium sp. NCHU2750]|uniref:hypothetical protein n=1 Tax=Neorhizobium sp. NCHU2750 TaxID=1825976 RepID=UPI000E76B335|nr:hypothetical protein NCHU2750_23650 [Neorhizobium sp. NCHU2750]
MRIAKLIETTTGYQVRLDDGSVYRAKPIHGNVIASWKRGDTIQIADRSNPPFHFELTNVDRGERINVMQSNYLL